MEFNVDKCHVVRFGISSKRPVWQYKLGNENIGKGSSSSHKLQEQSGRPHKPSNRENVQPTGKMQI